MERLLRLKLKGGNFDGVSAIRSATMGAIRGKGNRTTEARLRLRLVRMGLRGWTMHPDLPGRPDFYFSGKRVAVFVDGCFWHGCPKCGHIPKTNRAFWKAKIQRNRRRAVKINRDLKSAGLSVVRIWEHELQKQEFPSWKMERLLRALGGH